MIIMNKKSQFLKNLFTAFLAQGLSLLLSAFMSFVIPKFLGVKEYSYWQLFIFYSGYVGFFHFGFNDGVYLRLGGKKYEELDFKGLGTQVKIISVVEVLISLLIIVLTNFLVLNPERRIIWITTGIYLFLSNMTSCLGYIFQAVNLTKTFSVSVILDRISVLAFILLLLLRKQDSFEPFIITYAMSKAVALAYCIWKAKKIVFSKLANIHNTLADMWISFSVGIKLTIANIMSMLILGIGRWVIDNVWGIESFGKISLSLSLTNFFLVFIQQISMVLFPALRRVGDDKQKKIYNMVRIYLGLFLPIVFVSYFPLKFIVGWWLPQYSESLKYLGLLLPLCTFDGKMQMLCNTYLKVLRQEKRLLQINVCAFFISLCLCVFCGYGLNNINCVVASMVFSIAFRSIIAERFLAKEMGINIFRFMVQEIILVIIFVLNAWFVDELIAFGFTIIIYGIYLYINRKSIDLKQLMSIVKLK